VHLPSFLATSYLIPIPTATILQIPPFNHHEATNRRFSAPTVSCIDYNLASPPVERCEPSRATASLSTLKYPLRHRKEGTRGNVRRQSRGSWWYEPGCISASKAAPASDRSFLLLESKGIAESKASTVQLPVGAWSPSVRQTKKRKRKELPAPSSQPLYSRRCWKSGQTNTDLPSASALSISALFPSTHYSFLHPSSSRTWTTIFAPLRNTSTRSFVWQVTLASHSLGGPLLFSARSGLLPSVSHLVVPCPSTSSDQNSG
jgi:hypothetical protein